MLNRVTLIGRLGKDPEVRRLESGVAVAKFSLATSESYKDKEGNKVDTTEWHNVVVWRGQAEIAEKFLKKGMLIYVEGKLTYREYTDKDNVKKYFTEIVASNFQMLERKEGGGGGYFPGSGDEPSNTAAPRTTTNEASSVMEDVGEPPTDDLPF
ncbi:MAG: single-stranded DNA-binding protein [Saprospiraceae bacterium]|nr:single-stranded DNA-binding protein [Saprospiraceae bacterium]MCF8251051.1 single-stranded DNA-binding protein [Saprospiraceae bacterium]MCF8280336.1 single-stranded DNA-binding protein [Bacteroidales bacterium]MCF8312893.1 single-stranded DNA-binding protein [Saprospiraceae bacterium]MCF8441310.1 single-stranded DNA-binding protein [Saprospiraceae bacterium]